MTRSEFLNKRSAVAVDDSAVFADVLDDIKRIYFLQKIRIAQLEDYVAVLEARMDRYTDDDYDYFIHEFDGVQ